MSTGIDALHARVRRLHGKQFKTRTIVLLQEGSTYWMDGKRCTRTELDALLSLGHRLVIRGIPEGYMPFEENFT